MLDLGLRVARLGRSSVEWEVGVFDSLGSGEGEGDGDGEVKAVGRLVHVFVEREGGRPGKEGMGMDIWKGLERLFRESGGGQGEGEGGGGGDGMEKGVKAKI